MSIPTDDKLIHEKAVEALSHYKKHGDSAFMSRLVNGMPKSNRRTALIEWFSIYSAARWYGDIQRFKTLKMNKSIDLYSAKDDPFWNYKIKRKLRDHISGNTFKPKEFIEDVIRKIEDHADEIPIFYIEILYEALEKVMKLKEQGGIISDK